MRTSLGVVLVIALLGLHLAAFYAMLHPKVSREYRAYYIEKTSTDWHVKHYHSTPEDGIDLSKSGWPDFVEQSYGILIPESFGRWTDTRMGLRSGFRFNQQFSGTVCVEIKAMPSNSMRSQRVTLAFGDQGKDISLGPDEKIQAYLVDFELPHAADTLELRFSKALPRASHSNPRQVGVALNRVRILSKPCSMAAVPTTP
jgi:hypothetical protein